MTLDAYHRWLGIPPKEQPPNHYRLLAIQLFEDSPDVIEAAADRQMGHLRTYQAGEHSALSQKLLNEVAAARVCLINPEKKAKYDAALRKQLDARRKVIPKAKPLEPEPPLDSALVRLGETAGAGITRMQAARSRRQRPVVVGAVIGAAGLIAVVAVIIWTGRSSDPTLTEGQKLTLQPEGRKLPSGPGAKPGRASGDLNPRPKPAPTEVDPKPPVPKPQPAARDYLSPKEVLQRFTIPDGQIDGEVITWHDKGKWVMSRQPVGALPIEFGFDIKATQNHVIRFHVDGRGYGLVRGPGGKPRTDVYSGFPNPPPQKKIDDVGIDPPDQWHSMSLRAEPDRLRVFYDGRQVHEIGLPESPAKGSKIHVGLGDHRTQVSIRRVYLLSH